MKRKQEAIVIWGDPPPRNAGAAGRFEQHLHELKTRPGTWGNIARRADRRTIDKYANTVRNAAYARIIGKPGRWQFAIRRTPDGAYGLWGRWIPPGEERDET